MRATVAGPVYLFTSRDGGKTHARAGAWPTVHDNARAGLYHWPLACGQGGRSNVAKTRGQSVHSWPRSISPRWRPDIEDGPYEPSSTDWSSNWKPAMSVGAATCLKDHLGPRHRRSDGAGKSWRRIDRIANTRASRGSIQDLRSRCTPSSTGASAKVTSSTTCFAGIAAPQRKTVRIGRGVERRARGYRMLEIIKVWACSPASPGFWGGRCSTHVAFSWPAPQRVRP